MPGKHNIIADSLPRDFHLPPHQLAFILKSLFPSQVNKDFQILPKLPREIISWISSLRATSTKREVSPQTPDRSKMGTFFDGSTSWPNVVSRVNTLTDSLKKRKTNCSVALQRVLDEMSLTKQVNYNSEGNSLFRNQRRMFNLSDESTARPISRQGRQQMHTLIQTI